MCTIGVIHICILGPILFLIYVNDINNATTLAMLSLADDTKFITSSPDFKELYAEINFELTKLDDWFMANKLCLNVTKTVYLPYVTFQCALLTGHG